MNNVLEDSLFVSQTKKFDEIQSIVLVVLVSVSGLFPTMCAASSLSSCSRIMMSTSPWCSVSIARSPR